MFWVLKHYVQKVYFEQEIFNQSHQNKCCQDKCCPKKFHHDIMCWLADHLHKLISKTLASMKKKKNLNIPCDVTGLPPYDA